MKHPITEDKADHDPVPTADASDVPPGPESPSPTAGSESSLPVPASRELGWMLVSAGVIGVVLPGPGAPALVAGGLMLWPGAFARADQWMRRRFPEAHRKGMGHINRFLTDLERRYPGSIGGGDDAPPSTSP